MRGSQCPFRHTRGEKAVVCKHWLRGLCKKGEGCEFLHEYRMDKMPECYFYSKFGKLPTLAGLLAHFLSFASHLGSILLCGHTGLTNPLQNNNKGECSNPECMYRHISPEEKMKECPWYARGFCKHGKQHSQINTCVHQIFSRKGNSLFFCFYHARP